MYVSVIVVAVIVVVSFHLVHLVLCVLFSALTLSFMSVSISSRRSERVDGARAWTERECGRRPSVHVHGACVRSVIGSCLDPMPKPQWTRCTLWPELRACCYVLGARGCVHARMCAREDVRALARMHARARGIAAMCWALGGKICWAV